MKKPIHDIHERGINVMVIKVANTSIDQYNRMVDNREYIVNCKDIGHKLY